MSAAVPGWLAIVVTLLGVHAILKFAFFFLAPYGWRRRQLDRQYAGRATATAASDTVLLFVALTVAALLLVFGGEALGFLGGLWVGATLIQLFFHRFHADPAEARAAPAPLSPIKRLSYAIQDRPAHAWREMASFSVLVIAALVLIWR